MDGPEPEIYEFHNFRVNIGEGILVRNGQPVSLQWKTFELLCLLVKSNGRLVTRDEVMDELWADTFVEENNLRQQISALRKLLGEGENGNDVKFIETVPRCGYRFVPAVSVVETADETDKLSIRENGDQVDDVLDRSTFEPSSVIEPMTSRIDRSKPKVIEFPAPENSIAILSQDNTVVHDGTSLVVKQERRSEPDKSRRRAGLRRGLKALLWGLGVGFAFLIFLQVLMVFSVMLYRTPNSLSRELFETLGTLLGLLSVIVFFGWFLGIGLFLFGVARMIYAFFEKETSKLNASLVEKLVGAIIIVVIAAVAIPNIIASYRAAKEFQQSQMTGGQGQIRSIAVLPLKPFSPNADNEELRLRITDALITKLGGLKELVTRPTDSVLRFTNSEQSIVEIGRKLEVDAVLDGRMQQEGENVRVTLQLVSIPNGEQVWSQQFDGPADRILDLQDAISARVLQTLNQSRQQKVEFAARPTQNADAYEVYLKARYLTRRTDRKNLLRAIDYYQRAIELDPQFAESFAGMADVQMRLYVTQNEHNADILLQAIENMRTAVAIRPDSPFVLNTLAYKQASIDWDWENAEKTHKRVIEIDPNSSPARRRYAELLINLRRFEEAQSELELATRSDPTSAGTANYLGLAYFCKKDFVQAEREFRQALELDESFTHALWFLSRCLWMQGRKEESVKVLVDALDKDGGEILARKIEEKAKTSNPDDVIRFLIDEWGKNPNMKDFVSLAIRAMFVGDRERALNWLERSFEERHPKTAMIAALPDFEGLRNEPRFREILRKMNLP